MIFTTKKLTSVSIKCRSNIQFDGDGILNQVIMLSVFSEIELQYAYITITLADIGAII